MPVINSLIVKKSGSTPGILCVQKAKNNQNKVVNINSIIDLDGAIDIEGNALDHAYYKNQAITGTVDFSSLEEISGTCGSYSYSGSCSSMFYGCTGITSVNLSNLARVTGYYACYCMFQNCTGITDIDLSSLETITSNACEYMFDGCTSLQTIDLSSLISITGPNSCMFGNCTNLVSADLSGLVTVSGERGLQTFFSRCPNITTVNLESLTNLTGPQACSQMFYDSGIQSISFPSLSNINGNSVFGQTFELVNGVDVSFPALTSQSFGSYTNQFDDMFRYGNNNTVHFPSNLQSIIGSWQSVQDGFSGTNTTVLFDLPATE